MLFSAGPLVRTVMRPASWSAVHSAVGAHKDHLLAAGIVVICVVVLLFSTVRNAGDSRYTLVVSETLLQHGTVHLDRYFDGRNGGPVWPMSYHVRAASGHVDDVFPPGTSLLSMPFVAVFHLFGSRMVVDGAYRIEVAAFQQHLIATLLMAGLAVVLFAAARSLLSSWLAAGLVLATVFGSQIWSVASRGLWSHTWGIFLLGCALCLATRFEASGRTRSVRPVLLATLLSWSFFCRPTFAIAIVAVTLWMAGRNRRAFLAYAVTGGLWFCLFLTFSRVVYGELLPFYYQPGRISFAHFREAFLGNLISPSRGMLVYSPVLIVVVALASRHAWRSRLRWLCCAAVGGIVTHLIVVSGFPHWWAGHSYGPRLLTDLVPWWFVIAVAGCDGWNSLAQADQRRTGAAWPAITAALLGLSVLINGLGAVSGSSSRWSVHPVDIDQHPERLWDWTDPPFLRFLTESKSQVPVASAGQARGSD